MQGSKNRRGGTLWRSSRERRVWLKDTRRALHAEDTSCGAYVAAVLIDRCDRAETDATAEPFACGLPEWSSRPVMQSPELQIGW